MADYQAVLKINQNESVLTNFNIKYLVTWEKMPTFVAGKKLMNLACKNLFS